MQDGAQAKLSRTHAINGADGVSGVDGVGVPMEED